MNAAEADRVNRQLLGDLARPGLEPPLCPACGRWWWMCRNRYGRDLAHDRRMRRLARRVEDGALFEPGAIQGPVLGTTPLARYEGHLIDMVARGASVPAAHDTCASAPGECWHGQIWHKGRSGRLGACRAPWCQCLAFVSQRRATVPRQGGTASHAPARSRAS